MTCCYPSHQLAKLVASQAHSKKLKKGGIWVSNVICISRRLGTCSPKIRCSEIVSEAILGQKHGLQSVALI